MGFMAAGAGAAAGGATAGAAAGGTAAGAGTATAAGSAGAAGAGTAAGAVGSTAAVVGIGMGGAFNATGTVGASGASTAATATATAAPMGLKALMSSADQWAKGVGSSIKDQAKDAVMRKLDTVKKPFGKDMTPEDRGKATVEALSSIMSGKGESNKPPDPLPLPQSMASAEYGQGRQALAMMGIPASGATPQSTFAENFAKARGEYGR